MSKENILEFKIKGLQKALNKIVKEEGLSENQEGLYIKQTLAELGYSEKEAELILTEEKPQETINRELSKFSPDNNGVGYEINLNVKVSYAELKTLETMPIYSISPSNKMLELGTYRDLNLSDDRKHSLIEKYIGAAELIGADAILFYVAH